MRAVPQRFKFISWTAGATCALTVMFVLFWVDPSRRAIFPVCQFHRLTGLNCPGCGGLRATHHLLHGRVATAFHHNMLVVIAPPLLGLAALRWLIRKREVQAPQEISVHSPPVIGSGSKKNRHLWLWTGLIVVIVLFGILRNVPHPAFAWMSP